jgi:HEAT repeat protein
VPDVAERLKDPDPDVRRAAITALAELDAIKPAWRRESLAC